MEDQIRSAMLESGITPPESIYIDSTIHRFGKDRACWYIFFPDGVAAGSFGDWRTGNTVNWCTKLDRKITPEEHEINRQRVEQAKIKRDAEKAIARQDAKIKAKKIWESSTPAIDHPYLALKGIKSCGSRVNGDSLVIPLWDDAGEICSLQFIDADGEKRFLSNGQVNGCYFRIGKPSSSTICIAEGFATAATIHEATGYGVIVAFNAGKLPAAAELVRKHLQKANIIICADADAVGLEKANEAALAVDGVVVYPDGLPEGKTDFNDLAALRGLDAVRNSIIKTSSSENKILDSDIKYSSVDLLQYVDNDHILKKLSLYISEKTYLPPSTVFLCGLGVFSAISCRKYSVLYQDRERLPIGLYIVTEQPSGSGKSRCLKTFQKPFYEMSEKIHNEIMVEYKELMKNEGNLDDDEKLKLAELNHKLHALGTLFTTNATAEGLEKGLAESNGFFSAVSSEQGLFNVLFGSAYKSDSRANNNDVALNGFDGGFINSSRVTRKGYCGHVVGGIVCFAQSGSIETLLNSSNGTGLSERFLMLAEPHALGVRDHLRESGTINHYYDEYADKCGILESSINNQCKFNDISELYISDYGFKMIREYLNTIEPHLADGGKYSHSSMRGAASKIDMQIMKIAANLSLLGKKINIWVGISDKYIEAAINISSAMLEANLKLCQDKGVIGMRAEFEAILRLFEDNPKPRLERAIIQSRSKVTPFKDFSGNKSTRIREVLNDMVSQDILAKNEIAGIVSYKSI